MSSQSQFLSKCFLKKISTNFEVCDQFKPREKRQNSIDGAKRKKRAFKKIRFWLDATAAAVKRNIVSFNFTHSNKNFCYL